MVVLVINFSKLNAAESRDHGAGSQWLQTVGIFLANAATRMRAPRSVPMPVSSHVALFEAMTSKRRKKQTGIVESFHVELRQMVDALIARMFYTRGIPFNLARNSNYRASYNFIANNNIGGYVPPRYNMIRTTLLQQEKSNVEKLLEPIKTTWPLKGVTITSDGWMDAQRWPLINFLAITKSGPMFLRGINIEGEVKKEEYIAEKLIAVIEEVGAKNVVQVIRHTTPD